MKKFPITITFATVGTLAAAALGLAGTAAAQPADQEPADQTIARLQNLGYNVQINGEQTKPLSECTVTGVDAPEGVPGPPLPATGFTTISVDISCRPEFPG